MNSHEVRVLHVFESVCNLINEHREVLSVVWPQIGNEPFNIVLEDKVLFSEYLNLESPISVSANQLTLGDLTINIINAQLWSPRPDWEMLHTKRDDIVNQLTQLPITNHPPSLPASLLSNFSTSIVIADLPSALTTTHKLAGLGIGLTPAGDDFIMGALYAAWIIHPPEVARTLAEEIANTAALLTTSLSAAWLKSAGRGEAGILWHEFFDALISADPARVQEAMDKILVVGETSGADAMAGFMGLLIYWGEYCSNL